MKTLIAVVATIVLGIIIYGWIAGANNSMRSEGQRIMTDTITEMGTVQP